MKSIKNLAVLTAATMALVATGCQSKHKTNTETAKAETRTEHHVDQVEDSTAEAADGVAEMGRDIDREARATEADMEKATASTRDDVEDALAEGEKNAEETADEAAKDTVAGVDEAGDDVAAEIDLQSDKAEENVDATAKKAEKDTKATTKKAEKDVQAGADALDGKKVGAEVQKIDKDKRIVVFSIKDSADEIQLQAGKEMTVKFSEIAALTGLTEEEAIDKMHEGEDLEVRVLGVGDAMKIVKVDIGRF